MSPLPTVTAPTDPLAGDSPDGPGSLNYHLDRDLTFQPPFALMRHARDLVPLVRACDDPSALSAVIDYAVQIDGCLRTAGFQPRDRTSATELKLWRLGRWLIDANLRGGQRIAGHDAGAVSLASISLEKSLAYRCRRLARATEDGMERVIEQIRVGGDQVTEAELVDRIRHDEQNQAVDELTNSADPLAAPVKKPAAVTSNSGGRFVSQTLLGDLYGHTVLLNGLLISRAAYSGASAVREAGMATSCDASLNRMATHEVTRQLIATIAAVTGRAFASGHRQTDLDSNDDHQSGD